MTNPHPHNRIAIEEIAARNKTARHMIAGFSAEMPALADFWRHLDTALADNLALSVEVTRLNAELVTIRLDRANLLASTRATLAADADGETDPCTTSATSCTRLITSVRRAEGGNGE